MRGKALAIILAILVAGTAFALESGPSNPVGFYTVTVTHSVGSVGYNLVSFPTIPANDSLSQTLGSQLPGAALSGNATQIQWYNNHTSGYNIASKASSGITWNNTTGILQRLESRKGYYILLRSSAATSINVVVAGDVRTANWNMDTIEVGYNMVGSVYAASIPLANTNLVSGTVRMRGGALAGQSDQVQSYNGSFLIAYLTAANAWSPGSAFTTLDPGKGYFILRRAARVPPVFAWPDYPVPANTSSSDSYHQGVTLKTVANANTSGSSTDRVVTTPSKTVYTPATTTITSASTTSDVVKAPVKSKPTTAKAK